MDIARLVFNAVQENTYVVWDESKECIIIDAGMSNKMEREVMDKFISDRALKPVMALNTHGHFDHLMGVEHLRKEYNIPFALSSKDQYLLDGTPSGSVIYGMTLEQMPSVIDIDLATTKEIKFGNTTLQVIPTPGHTPGHVSLLERDQNILFTGDTLFKESIGRTDLPGGDYPTLMDSIVRSIIPLGDQVTIYAGHAEESSIGHESLYNPFVVEVLRGEIKY